MCQTCVPPARPHVGVFLSPACCRPPVKSNSYLLYEHELMDMDFSSFPSYNVRVVQPVVIYEIRRETEGITNAE